jgi:hypothetical protein
LAFQNDNYYINDKLCPTYSEALKPSIQAAYRTKQAVSTITEAGGYCVFKKFIQNFTGIIKKNIMAKKNIEIKDLVQERKQTNLMHYQPF